MTRRVGRALECLGMSLLLALVAGMAGWWWIDRTTVYERPQWDEAHFERIEEAGIRGAAIAEAPAVRPPRETWVVAVNPACGHCLAMMTALADTLATGPGAPRLLALIVDTAARPADGSLSHPRLDAVFWDRESVWRARWGHRLYGEILRFDAGGNWIDVPRAGG